MICHSTTICLGESIIVEGTTLTYTRVKEHGEIVIRISCPDHVGVSMLTKRGRERQLNEPVELETH